MPSGKYTRKIHLDGRLIRIILLVAIVCIHCCTPSQPQVRRVGKGRVAASLAPKNNDVLPNSDVEEESCNNDSDYENHDGVILRETIIMKKTLEFSSRPPDTMYINSMGGDWRTHGAIDY